MICIEWWEILLYTTAGSLAGNFLASYMSYVKARRR